MTCLKLSHFHFSTALGLVFLAAAITLTPTAVVAEDIPLAFEIPFEIRFDVIDPPVVAQEDITVTAAKTPHDNQHAPLECSSIDWFDGRIVMSSDRHMHLLFSCAVDMNTMTISRPKPFTVIRNENDMLDDAEAIAVQRDANGRPYAFVMCSLSNDRSAQSLPQRRRFLRIGLQESDQSQVPFDAADVTVLSAGALRNQINTIWQKAGIEPYRTYYSDYPGETLDEKNTYRWGNVEGITFSPDGKKLLCAMRNPLPRDMAMVFVVENVPAAFVADDSSQMKIIDLFTLDLEKRGISDIHWDAVSGGYLVMAAKSNGPRIDRDQPFPPSGLDGALFWWSGKKTDKPILIATLPDMTVEAVCRLGKSPYIALASDEGDISEGRSERQSVMTIVYFPGLSESQRKAPISLGASVQP